MTYINYPLAIEEFEHVLNSHDFEQAMEHVIAITPYLDHEKAKTEYRNILDKLPNGEEDNLKHIFLETLRKLYLVYEELYVEIEMKSGYYLRIYETPQDSVMKQLKLYRRNGSEYTYIDSMATSIGEDLIYCIRHFYQKINELEEES